MGALMALALTLALGVALAGAVAPVVTVENAENAEYTTADVKGEVNAEGKGTSYHFEYGTAADFSNASAAGFDFTELTATPELHLTGLQPSATYHLRLVAANEDGEAKVEAANTFTTKAVAKPLVSGLAATATHFSGFANPNAPEDNALLVQLAKDAYATHWRFSCSPGCGFSGPSEGDLAADDSATEVSADPTGLTPNQAYDVTLHATNAGGEEAETVVGAFATAAVKPTVLESPTFDPRPTTATLAARVDLHNAPLSDCRFVYGAGSPSGSEAICEDLPGGYRVARISGLKQGTDYEYKLIVSNIAGTEEGEVQEFHTPQPQPAGGSCLNEDRRAEQHAGGLPDCRAYERVSPADKNGGDIIGDQLSAIASADGNAMSFSSRSSFGDTIGAGFPAGHTQYVARRGSAGWRTHAINPTPQPVNQPTFSGTEIPLLSEDLRTALVWAYDLPESTDDTPFRKNIYLEDTLSGALTPITVSHEEPIPFTEFLHADPPCCETFAGLSADGKHVLLNANVRLLPGAADGAPSVYKWNDGELQLVNILPGGAPAPGGGIVRPTNYRGAISRDGSRAIFLSPANGNRQLYLRIGDTNTAWVSESEHSGAQLEAENVSFESMTPDGRTVFFVTSSRLTDDDTNDGSDLYRYTDGPNPAGETNLRLISHSGELKGEVVIGSSDDGQRVYYKDSVDQLFFWDHGRTRFIAANSHGEDLTEGLVMAATGWGPGAARVSPDGSWLAFLSAANLGASEGPARALTAAKVDRGLMEENGQFANLLRYPREMYLYGADDNTLSCVSCRPDVVNTFGATVKPAVTEGIPGNVKIGIRPHFLLADGTVFFTDRGEDLAAEDTNGVADTYQYDPSRGKPELLSSGTDQDRVMFVDASQSGGDVFMISRQRLVGADIDGLADMYDARIGGGFSEPPLATTMNCSGERCQGDASPPNATSAPASTGASRGNLKQRRSHRQLCHRKHRCHRKKKHSKLHHRSANSDRGAAK